jgi:L-cysteine desulfidase
MGGYAPEWLGGNGATGPLGPVEHLEVEIDANVYKNAFAVGIPRTGGKVGIELAAALGSLCNPALGLNLFSSAGREELRQAQAMVEAGLVSVKLDKSVSGLSVAASCRGGGHEGTAQIRHQHSLVQGLWQDGVQFYQGSAETVQGPFGTHLEELARWDLKQVVAAAESLPEDIYPYLLEGLAINAKAAKRGLASTTGLGVGRVWQEITTDLGMETDSLLNQILVETAAACDARMAGEDIAVMSSAGSGNQGIVVSQPLAVLARLKPEHEERLGKALALAHLVTLYITYYTGYLTPVCGCVVKAGTGAAAGMAYYLGGDAKVIGGAINNMAANALGILCDGAKVGCALKLATSASAAAQCALLALRGLVVPAGNGVVDASPERTIRNVGRISQSMNQTDSCVLDVLTGAS